MTKIQQGICLLPAVAVYENPAENSRLTNQLLFGDRVAVEDGFKEWYYIRTEHDDWAGWIKKNRIVPLDESLRQKIDGETESVTETLTTLIEDRDGNQLLLSAGSTLYGGLFRKIISGSARPVTEANAEEIGSVAGKFLNIPYLWGGRTVMGMDSAGFVQVVFKIAGFALPRTCKQQANTGEACYLFNETRPGDLIFFTDNDEEENINHVGIFLGNSAIIHADEKVRIDTIDHYGIYNVKEDNYSYKLKAIQRVLKG